MPSQYLTVAELLGAPLGLELRSIPATGSTGPGGVIGQQTYEELTNVILRASAMADLYCHQTLGATQDSEEGWTDSAKAGIDNNGYLWLHTNNWPVLSVSVFQYGYPALGGTAWTVATLSDLIMKRSSIVYPAWLDRRNTPPVRVQATYLNGWPNTLLTASVAGGATGLPVVDATGIMAGARLTIFDQGNTEQVTVASTWLPAPGPASVALAAGTQFAHTPYFRPTTPPQQPYDVSVSALPADVKQAVLLICKFLVEQRGSTALVMGRTGGISGTAQTGKAAMEEMPLEAQYLLDPYRRVV